MKKIFRRVLAFFSSILIRRKVKVKKEVSIKRIIETSCHVGGDTNDK